MKRLADLLFALIPLLVASLALGQEQTGGFQVIQELGLPRPDSMLYDPNFDRLVIVDFDGTFRLVNARTYETERVLDVGYFTDYALSHNGRWLALTGDNRINLFETATGEQKAQFTETGGSLAVQGPLLFSDDDTLLQFNGVYRAPQATRRSENDTNLVPWLWDIADAVGEAESTLPNRVQAVQFFDYRNGFVLGPNDRAIAALPSRIQVLNARTLEVVQEFPAARFEQDPLQVWFSALDGYIYIDGDNTGNLTQLNTVTGEIVDLRLNQLINPADLNAPRPFLSAGARMIGQPNSREGNSLQQVLFGSAFDAFPNFNGHPLTISLVDFIVPAGGTVDQTRALVHVYDDHAALGMLTVAQPQDAHQLVPNPDGRTVLVRRFSGQEPLELYDLDTGAFLTRFLSSELGLSRFAGARRQLVLAFNRDGTEVINDFQRINAGTGEVLYQDMRYTRPFEQFYFSADSRKMVTVSGGEWRLWDVETGETLRTATLRLNGDILATQTDGERILTANYNNEAPVMEVVDIAKNTRQRIQFENLLNVFIEDIIPSPDWAHFLVVYGANPADSYSPGNQIALYGLGDGKLWFMAGDDLPSPNGRRYGWIDDRTAFVYGEGYGNDQPVRVYGIEYDVSGLPSCLVAAFPDAVERWADTWERVSARRRTDTLDLFTSIVCSALPASTDEIAAILEPPPQPVPLVGTATPVVVAGVPICLTIANPVQALDYAEDWRAIIAGLSPDEVAEAEEMLCESLGFGGGGTGGEASTLRAETMFIDVLTGERSVGDYSFPEAEQRPLFPVEEAYFRATGRSLSLAKISPDGNLLAEMNPYGFLTVYRMPMPYTALVGAVTATADAAATAVNLISVRPSPTPTFDIVGTPRPTFTPTVTVTSPPPVEATAALSEIGQFEHICPVNQLYTVFAPPENYSPTGRITGSLQGNTLWAIDPQDGHIYPDATLPQCNLMYSCQFSPDFQWLVGFADSIFVMRPDGSERHELFTSAEQAVWPSDLHWNGSNLIEWTIVRELPTNPVLSATLTQRYSLSQRQDLEPVVMSAPVVNGLYTELVTRQPGGVMAVVRTSFNTLSGPGYKFYTYDLDTGAYRYFARTSAGDPGPFDFVWSPLGDKLYYQQLTPGAEVDASAVAVSAGLPTMTASPLPPELIEGEATPELVFSEEGALRWYVYDPATDTHGLLGDFFGAGSWWSQDGRYIAANYYDEAYPEQGLQVWDSHTGETRTYCLPEIAPDGFGRGIGGPVYWSPDSRYLAFLSTLPGEEAEIGSHVLILDLTTGTLTDAGIGFPSPLLWIPESETQP